MNISWTETAKVDSLLKEYFTKDSGLRNGLLTIFERIELIISLISFGVDLTDIEKRGLIKNSFFYENQNSSNLLYLINEELSKFLKSEKKKFIVLTAFKLPNGIILEDRIIENNRIEFNLPITDEFNKTLTEEASLIVAETRIKFPPFVTYVKTNVTARSESQAYELASFSSNYLRSIWTLISSHGRYSKSFSGKPKPIGPFPVGPLHTIHDQNGKVSKALWYQDHDYNSDRAIKVSVEHWPYIEEQTKFFLSKIDSLNYALELKKLLIRYANALDCTSFDTTILQLCGVLEDLVGDPRKTKIVVNRVSSAYKDQEKCEMLLSLAYNYRHSWAHSGESDGRDWWITMNLKQYVEDMINLHLIIGSEFSLIDEFGEYLPKIQSNCLIVKDQRMKKILDLLKMHNIK